MRSPRASSTRTRWRRSRRAEGSHPPSCSTSRQQPSAIKDAITSAAGQLEAGDIFFVTYSGHGGQVPDLNDEDEKDGSDETWLAYDRQVIDDELFELWTKFKPGVRILVLSDSCHSGSVNKSITNGVAVPDPVATAEEADKQEPRFRAMPRDKMIETYGQHLALYDRIQRRGPELVGVGGEARRARAAHLRLPGRSALA